MQILFDHQIFSNQLYGGISRYFCELISGVNKTKGNEAYLSLLLSNNVHLEESDINVLPFLPKYNVRGKHKFIHKVNQLISISQLQCKSYNIFHATYYDPYFIPHLKNHKFVITFLDMIHEKFLGQFPEFIDDGIFLKQKQIIAKSATRIIAISESTKRDIIELLNVDPDKIDVVHLGSSIKTVTLEHVKEKQYVDPYILFVGRRERYKNFAGMIQAIHPLLKKHKLKLICGGGGPFTSDEYSLIQSLGLSTLVEQRFIHNDLTLQTLYQQALVFIFPTLYEGFGIPILEAFSCQCPCLLSNSSSLPEVAGEAALYFDPGDKDSIYNVVNQVINDESLRNKLIACGTDRLKLFSWDKMVNETLSVYDKCFER